MTTWNRESTYNIKYLHFVSYNIVKSLYTQKFSPKQYKHECNVDRTLQLCRSQSRNVIPMLSGCWWPLGWSPCDNVQSDCFEVLCNDVLIERIMHSLQWDFHWGFLCNNAKCNNSKKVRTKRIRPPRSHADRFASTISEKHKKMQMMLHEVWDWKKEKQKQLRKKRLF